MLLHCVKAMFHVQYYADFVLSPSRLTEIRDDFIKEVRCLVEPLYETIVTSNAHPSASPLLSFSSARVLLMLY